MDEDTIFEAPGRRHIIKRPRLTRMLDEATARIILLVAPAGYGKTTLAREWLAQGDRQSAWYAAGPASADVAGLALGLARSMATLVPGADRRLLERVRASTQPESEAELLADLLAEDLERWPNNAWLFVDDYHQLMDAEPSENFFDVLIHAASLNILLASRQRPTWASARRILYGEVHELGRNTLAFTADEANELLAFSHRSDAPGLIQLADGWPAVLGLAALSGETDVPDSDLPDKLYEYFAEELYQKAGAALRLKLCQLSLAPSLTRDLAVSLLGGDAQVTLQHAAELGFVTPERNGSWSLHPLVRAFLREKLYLEHAGEVESLVTDVGRRLIRHEHWDDAFALVEAFSADGLLSELLESALHPLLEEGRLVTLSTWTGRRQDQPQNLYVLDVARAELALRSGDTQEAEVLAARAARELPAGHSLLSAAWLVAGRAAHLECREQAALEYLQQAEACAANSSDLHRSRWIQFVASMDLGSTEAARILERLQEVTPESADDEVRVAAARSIHASRVKSITEGIGPILAIRPLLTRVKDPMTRSMCLAEIGNVLNLAARYDEALEALDRALDDVSRYRLTFARPHILVHLAVSYLGLRQFARAHKSLEEAISGTRSSDPFCALVERAVRTRLFVAEGRFGDAVVAASYEPDRLTTPLMQAEYLASRGLALASSDLHQDALHAASAASRSSTYVEAQGLAACVRAVVAIRSRDPNMSLAVDTAFRTVTQTGSFDALVSAYRACPELAIALAQNPLYRSPLTRILSLSRDSSLAVQAGLLARQSPRRTGALTRREEEVYERLAQGLTNREIARALFISEVTVKVHVRHILEKLGVKSRTQAAIRAALSRTNEPAI